jgi:hypothetical protein
MTRRGIRKHVKIEKSGKLEKCKMAILKPVEDDSARCRSPESLNLKS